MEPMPSVPTDNLYKFLAIFGLVLVVGAIVFPIREEMRLHAEVTDLDVAMAIEQTNQEALVRRVERAWADANDLTRDVPLSERQLDSLYTLLVERERTGDRTPIPELDSTRLPYYLELQDRAIGLSQRGDSLSLALLERQRQGVRLNGLIRKLSLRVAQHELMKRLAALMVVPGIVMMAAGFVLWYVKVQRPLDLAAARGMEGSGDEPTE